MKLKNFFSLVTLFTLSTGLSVQLPAKADNIVYRPREPREIGCKKTFTQLPHKLVKASGTEIFLIQNGIRRWITDSKTFDECGFDFSKVKQVFDEELAVYPEGLPISNNGTLLKNSKSEIYIVMNGTRRLVTAKVFNKYRFRYGNVSLVPDEKLRAIPQGSALR